MHLAATAESKLKRKRGDTDSEQRLQRPAAPPKMHWRRERKLSASENSPYLFYEGDGLTVSYAGKANHALDYGTARGQQAFGARLRQSGGLGYFEVEVLSAGASGWVANLACGRGRCSHFACLPAKPLYT